MFQDHMVSVIIPSFNEERTIGSVISSTISVMENLGLPYEIIVVDDGSKDHTKLIAAKYEVTLIGNGTNKGKGFALRTGFKLARGDIVVMIDSDGAHDPKEIPKLIKPLFNGTDIVVGSRFLGHNGHFTRKINKIGNHLINSVILILTGEKITDSQTGFRAFKKEFLQSTSLESLGYGIESELTVKGLKNGFHYKEIPIHCEQRKYDESKLKIVSDGPRILTTIFKASFSDDNHFNQRSTAIPKLRKTIG